MPYKDIEKRNANSRKYYANNKEKHDLWQKKWNEANRERLNAYHKKYIEEHKEFYKDYFIKWEQDHRKERKEKRKELDKIRIQTHKKERQDACKRWHKQHPEKRQEYNNIRRDDFGFIPLNNYVKGYEAHHVNKECVIYIPKYIHRQHWHNHKKPETMKEVNRFAFNCLFGISQQVKL